MKPGYKTTEFWAMIAASIGSILAASQNIVPDKYAALVSAVAVAAYAISRGLAKSNTPGA